MTRDEVFNEIRETLGGIPQQFAALPDWALEPEWTAWRKIHIDNTTIPGKYRSLIGLSVAATIQCPHSMYAHREMAAFQGASDQEIAEALLIAKDAAGWSTFMAGIGVDLETYEKDVDDQMKALAKRRKAA